jgi:hypothetical protein
MKHIHATFEPIIIFVCFLRTWTLEFKVTNNTDKYLLLYKRNGLTIPEINPIP